MNNFNNGDSLLMAILMIIGFFAFIFCISLVLALPVMWLWNWIVVDFGLPKLTFWKSWGLLILCLFLFKSIEINRKNK